MNDKNIKINISKMKKIVMTPDEKSRVYNNILNNQIKHNENVKSPWSFYYFSYLSSKSRFAYLIIVPLIFIISGGSVVFASTDSLPDSILYPIKVNVLEPAQNVLNFSAKSKARHESKLAEKRLIEAEILAEKGKLDKNKEEKINKLLSKHTEALDRALNDNELNDQDDEVEMITTDFRAHMNAHAKVLEVLTHENSIDSEDDFSEVKISNTARLGAEKIKNLSDKKDDDKIKKIKEKKEKIKSIIDDTDNDINLVSSENKKNNSLIIENTYKKIDQAKAYLYDAEKKDVEGDFREAYSSLLDSETTVKEAKILLEEGKKINKNKEIRSFDEEDND